MEEGNASEQAITPFAITDYRNTRKLFGIKDKNRSGHMYILGKTGTGKSTLIANLIVSDIERNHGVALIDPHGDLAESILDLVPERRINDVIYFNPADLDYPIAFNALESVSPDRSHLIASGLISAFRKIWGDFWGPRMEHILRYSILALLECPGSTLLDIALILTDKEFRHRVLEKINNPGVLNFWLMEFERYSSYHRSEAIAPIQNKVGQFLATPLIRNIVGQPKSAFTLRQIMDEGKIFIANLSKGRIGEDYCSLLGSLLVTKLHLAALERADIPAEKRQPYYLFIDEVHSFLTLNFVDILAESRKYGLYLAMSHQYIEQLDERIRPAILGNVGTIISFRVGVDDAKYLARVFHPIFDETDILNLPNHHIYLKMMIDERSSEAFSAITMPFPKSAASYRKRIIEFSMKHYGSIREEVENKIVLGSVPKPQKKSKRQPPLF
jgi:type IV secretory pathway TraG/TraD family ATPase VirD4